MSAGNSEYNSVNVTEGPILQLYLIRYILELMISTKIVSCQTIGVFIVYHFFCLGNVSGYIRRHILYGFITFCIKFNVTGVCKICYRSAP